MSIKVLVVEDSGSIRKMIWANLKVAGMDVYEAENGLEGYEKAKELQPDVILMDVMMPIMDGIEACRKIRADSATSSLYIIMLTAKSRTEDKVEGLEAGADDYVSKPFEPEELVARIRRGDIIGKQRSTATREKQTGLVNKAAFDAILDRELARCERYEEQFALVFSELDSHEQIHETFGRTVGDEVVQHVSGVMRNTVRKSDVMCRWSGDVFGIILTGASAEQATEKATKLKDLVCENPHPVAGNVTICSGVAVWSRGDTLDTIAKRASEALQKAKGHGCNNFEVAEGS